MRSEVAMRGKASYICEMRIGARQAIHIDQLYRQHSTMKLTQQSLTQAHPGTQAKKSPPQPPNQYIHPSYPFSSTLPSDTAHCPTTKCRPPSLALGPLIAFPQRLFHTWLTCRADWRVAGMELCDVIWEVRVQSRKRLVLIVISLGSG